MFKPRRNKNDEENMKNMIKIGSKPPFAPFVSSRFAPIFAVLYY